MKYFVETKERGEHFRKKIREIAKYVHPLTEGNVQKIMGYIPNPLTFNYIFDNAEVIKKIRLRETKDGWFLYLPEPIETIDYSSEPVEPECTCSKEEHKSEEVLDRLADAIASLADMNWMFPNCRYIIKPKKNSIQEQKAYYIGTFQSTMPSDNGVVISQPLSIIVMVNDGTVRQVKPTSLIFDMEEE